jgi:hypothetical protein
MEGSWQMLLAASFYTAPSLTLCSLQGVKKDFSVLEPLKHLNQAVGHTEAKGSITLWGHNLSQCSTLFSIGANKCFSLTSLFRFSSKSDFKTQELNMQWGVKGYTK